MAKTKETPKEPGTQVGPVKEQATAVIPANMQAMLQEDSEDRQQFDKSDLAIPFLRVLQSNSPQVDDQDPAYVEGAKVGDFINTVSNEMWEGPGEGIILVPAYYEKSFIEWALPRAKGTPPVKDWGKDPIRLRDCHKDEDTNKNITPEGNELVTSALYFVLIVDPTGHRLPERAVFPLAGTQLKKAKGWNSKIAALQVPIGGKIQVPPMFYMSYRITTVPEENEKGKWRGVKIVYDTPVLELPNGEAIYLAAREFKKAAAAGEVRLQPVDPLEGMPTGDNGPDVEIATGEPGKPSAVDDTEEEDDDLPF